MVGIPSFKNAATIGYVVRAAQAGLVQYFPDLHPVVVNADAGSPDGTGRVVIETEPPELADTAPYVTAPIATGYPRGATNMNGRGAALATAAGSAHAACSAFHARA